MAITLPPRPWPGKTAKPADYYSSYGYRHNLPGLNEDEWRRGLRWRWLTEDISVGDGEGIMACYLAKIGWRQWLVRLLFGSYAEYCQANQPIRVCEEPVAEEPWSYPPGLDLDAFFFRLDLKGNPRDKDFEWAWMRPLLPVPERPKRRRIELTLGSARISHLPLPRDPEPRPRDEEFEGFMESEYITLDEYRAVKAGKLPDMNKRLHTFDDRYQRPTCRCGRSHPELHTPLRDVGPDKTDWHYKKSFYQCLGCDRKWQSANLRAALEMQPLVKPVRLRKADVPHEDDLPEQLLKPPSTK